MEEHFSIPCPNCQHTIHIQKSVPKRFCPFCGKELDLEKHQIHLEPPGPNQLISNRYQLIEKIGKGGMGEVFLAFDVNCGRKIALKQIRTDLLDHPQIRHRFLKEAHITCQLTHPSIIPIYSIQAAQLSAYYTMPFVEGETLKQIIRKTGLQEKQGEKLNHIGGSIPALIRIFISICQAVAYAHAKGVLHRDLKPENIIIGKYGEVLILDWGLAKYIHSNQSEEEDVIDNPSIMEPHNHAITRLGKVVGTVAYMAPERALGQPATIHTDIYSLGVILYQLLTLKSPFKRGKLNDFRKTMNREEWIDPILAAPYRDIPKILSRIAKKCTSSNPGDRYETVDQLLHELENYIEGRSEWFHVADLNVNNKLDWEFQEHVLIAEHLAITRQPDEAEWVNLMISKESFQGNTKIETAICLKEGCHGIGILLSIPESSERKTITDGYSLWLSSDKDRSTKLLRSNVEVMQAPDIYLKNHQWTNIKIEKIDKTIHLYIDEILQFSYIAHLPVIGTHIGILSRDTLFEMEALHVFVGSLNLTINCLAVPDAFLAQRDYNQALSEYRRIAYSFPDRPEGREATFRAGLTFIEQSKSSPHRETLLEEALNEFEKLHGTPGGPLEYLGKALVYQAQNENEEEIKCFELAYRRYPRHPLLPILQEQILSRMHEVSRLQRIATYRFTLLSARHLPPSAIDTHTRRLFTSLQKHWEPLPFIEEHSSKISSPHYMHRFAIPLAFWLSKPFAIGEIIDEIMQLDLISTHDLGNALCALLYLGAWEFAKTKLEQLKEISPFYDVETMIRCHEEPLEDLFEKFFFKTYQHPTFSQQRLLHYAIDRALEQKRTDLVLKTIELLGESAMTFDDRLRFNQKKIYAQLLEKNWSEARVSFYNYPVELLSKEGTPLHFLYGCWLQATEGKEMAMIHFMGILPATYPRTWTLASHELIGDLRQRGWFDQAFLWEKRILYRQLSLYYHCSGNTFLSEEYT